MKTHLFVLTKTTFRVQGVYNPDCTGEDSDGQNRLFVDGIELSLTESLRIRSHSPSGFNWGYGGSGPAQSALAICLHIYQNRYVAETLYQHFKQAFVSRWQPQLQTFDVTIDIADFLIEHRDLLQQAVLREEEEDELAGWGLVEDAYGVLSSDNRSPSPGEPVRPEPTSRYKVGDVVRVLAPFLETTAGSRAVVYECYEQGGISLITETGDDLGGFAPDEQEKYLEYMYHADGFTYTFRSVNYLHADWHRGAFLGVFR